MRRAATLITLAAALAASLVSAEAPERSLRPEPRQDRAGTPARAAAPAEVPRERSGSATPRGDGPEITAATTARDTAAVAAPRRSVRPESGGPSNRELRRNAVCGDIALQGEAIGNVPGPGACGVKDAVRLRSVSGIALSTPAVINCDTARALKTWVETGVVPAFRRRGEVVELQVAAHYACRTRNNIPGGRLSEHAKGNAIDISGFRMSDGQVYTVRESWWRGRGSKPMQQAYAKACGPFGTTLGPTSDRYHQDHFHFDVARYRSGPYCK